MDMKSKLDEGGGNALIGSDMKDPSSETLAGTGITLTQRMASACIGSVLTSVLVTPFDVVRIRLQQQEMLFPKKLVHAEQCCRKVFWEDGSKTHENPFCVENSCVNEAKLNGTLTGIVKIGTNEGLGALYRGLFLTLIMAVPSNVVYFSGYDILKTRSPISKDHPVLNPLLCGAFARILAATAVAPMELIKTRLQAVPANHKNTRSSAIMKMVMKKLWTEIGDEGPLSMFKGLQLTLWRDVPFSAIYWAAYESISKTLKNTQISRERQVSSPGSDIFLTSFLSGSLAGITAAFCTNPFDVGKTRFQVAEDDTKEKYGTLSELVHKSNGVVNATKKQSMFSFLHTIYINEGIKALYVGIFPRCLKIAPACAIMISTYELSKEFFEEKSGMNS